MSTIRLFPQRIDQLVERYAESRIPTAHGTFRVVVFREISDHPAAQPVEHLAVIAGDLAGDAPVPVRVHSECWTGETLGSLKCDCRAQLDHALAHIAAAGRGVVVYLRQEGRGIGLGNKIRAYALQEKGADTVDANRLIGFADDLRTYEPAACILRQLGVEKVSLITNNPLKLDGLAQLGIDVAGRIPSITSANPHSAGYLDTKRVRMGHLLGEGNATSGPATKVRGS